MPGTGTSEAEVIGIDRHGLWLLVGDKEYFLSHEAYPWFQQAKLSAVQRVELLHGSHLHWPDLDVDLSVASLEHPDRYPLVYKQPQ